MGILFSPVLKTKTYTLEADSFALTAIELLASFSLLIAMHFQKSKTLQLNPSSPSPTAQSTQSQQCQSLTHQKIDLA